MSLRLCPLDTYDDPEDALRSYLGADAAAFGWPFDPAQLEAKRAIIDLSRYLVAMSDGEPVGTAGSFAVELTLPGGAQVAAGGVSDVGVVPTHRRRGVLTALMAHQLADLRAGGAAVAVLHASEASIYDRFGYGPCTGWRAVRIDARRVVFREDLPDPGGSLHVLQRSEAAAACAEVHDRVRRRVPGGISRTDAWWAVVLGDVDVYLGGTASHLVMVHRDEGGRSDGYAIYRIDHDWSRGQANHTLAVWELVGVSPAVELALWRALLEHDLVATVTGPIAVDHPLFDVVVDARQIGVDWEQDLLWARPLDVATLLSARSYGAAGDLVLAVEDPLIPEVGGAFELHVDDAGAGECRRTTAEAQLTLNVAELGSVLLGGTSLRRLARAGRLRAGSEQVLALADAMFSVDPLPWCWVRF